VPKGWFGWTDFNEGPIKPNKVWGVNMTVRAKVFSDHRFFEGIGPNGTRKYVVGSDIEFTLLRRAICAGIREARLLDTSFALIS